MKAARRPLAQYLPQLDNTREADEYWADLNEGSLFANDFIMSKFANLRDNREFEALSFLEQNNDPYKFSGIVDEDLQGKEDAQQQSKADISHFFKEILSISSGIANSSFSGVHYKRTKLLRRIQEAWWRQSQRDKQKGQQPSATTLPKGLRQSIDPSRVVPIPQSGGGLFDDFSYQAQPVEEPVIPKPPETEPKPDPKKQTLDALYSLLRTIDSHRQLRENIPGIFQLLSDLPPYSLFHEKEPSLDAFEELLISFIGRDGQEKDKGGKKSQGESRSGANIFVQAEALLLVLGLLKGSMRTSLLALSRLLTGEVPTEEEKVKSPKSTRAGGEGEGEGALPGVIPYLKQLEDYRHHKEVCSLFEEAYQGAWKYHWRDNSYTLFAYSQSQRNPSNFASIATDGVYLYVVNKDGLLKLGTGFSGTTRGCVYRYQSQFAASDKGWLACVENTLYYREQGMPVNTLRRFSCETLEEEKEVKLPASDKGLQNPMDPDSYVPLLSDGRYLYLVGEVRVPSSPFQVEYRLHAHDPAQNFDCISTTTLQGPHTLTGQHHGVVCDGCQRSAFRGTRYRCTSASTCREYNLCHTCQQLGVVSKQHTKEHTMDPVVEPQPGSATAPLTAQCMSSAHFFITGYQLGVLLPPGISPNTLRRNKSMCRVFNLRSGRHVHDFMVENWNNGITACFDKTNNLLWTHSADMHAFMKWTHFGRMSPSLVNTDPVAMLTQNTLPQGKTSPQQGLGRQKVAMILLANMHLLADRLSACKKTQVGMKHPFSVEEKEQNQEALSALYSLLIQLVSPLSEVSAAGADNGGMTMRSDTVNPASNLFVLNSLLHILRTNLYHIVQLKKQNDEASAGLGGMVLFDVRDFLLRLATEKFVPNELEVDQPEKETVPSSGEKLKPRARRAEEKLIQQEARQCLMVGFDLFYPSREKKIQLLMELLARVKEEDAKRTSPGGAEEVARMGTRLLFAELLEQISAEYGLSEDLFARLESEKIPPKADEKTEGKPAQGAKEGSPQETKKGGEADEPAAEATKPVVAEEKQKETSEAVLRELIAYALQDLMPSSGKVEDDSMITSDGVKKSVAQAVNKVVLTVQRDLLGLLGSKSVSAYEESGYSSPAVVSDTSEAEDIARALRFALFLFENASDTLKAIQPRLKEGQQGAVEGMALLRNTIIGAVLPALLTSLSHFSGQIEFVPLLPKLCSLMEEMDLINKTVQPFNSPRSTEKRQALTRSSGSLRKSLTSSSADYDEEEQEPGELAWFFDLEKALGVLCGSFAEGLVSGNVHDPTEDNYLVILQSDLLSGGLEASELAKREKEDELEEQDKGKEAMEIEEPAGDFFAQLIACGSNASPEAARLSKWLIDAATRLPVPEGAVEIVHKAIKAVFAVLVKHSGLEAEALHFAKQLLEQDKGGARVFAPPGIQAALNSANGLRLWITQQQQQIISEAVKKQEEADELIKKQQEEIERKKAAEAKAKEVPVPPPAPATKVVQPLPVVDSPPVSPMVIDLGAGTVVVEAEIKGKEKDTSSSDSEEEEEAVAEPEKVIERPAVPTREEAYTKLANQLLQGSQFLLKYVAARSTPLIEEVEEDDENEEEEEGKQRVVKMKKVAALDKTLTKAAITFIQQNIPLEDLDVLIDSRRLRGSCRAKGLDTFREILQLVSFPSIKQEIVKYLGRSLRKQGAHFLAGLESCCTSQLNLVTQHFTELLLFLLSLLTGDEGMELEEDKSLPGRKEADDYRFKVLVLNGLTFEYKMADHTILLDSNLLTVLQKLSSASAVPTVSVPSYTRRQQKKLVRVARSLFCLLATKCLEWVNLPSHVAVLENSKEDKIIKIQDEILGTIFNELGKNLLPPMDIRAKKDLLNRSSASSVEMDDEYHHSLLALVYRMRHTAAMKRYFSSPKAVIRLLSLLEIGSPRVQRLTTRLCKFALSFLKPEDLGALNENAMETDSGEGKKPDIAAFFMDILGKLLSGDYAPEVPEQVIRKSPRALSASAQTQDYALIVQRPIGTTLSDLLRMMPQAQLSSPDGPEVNVKDIVRELKAIDQAVIVRDATQKQCSRYAAILAGKGFSATIVKQEPGNKKNDESVASRARSWRSRLVDFSLASEIVSLLRSLFVKDEKWGQLLREKIKSYLSAIADLTALIDGKAKGKEKDKEKEGDGPSKEELLFQKAFAAVAVLGGWTEVPRIAGKVVHQHHNVPGSEDNAGEGDRVKFGDEKTGKTPSVSSEIGTVVSFQSPHVVKVQFPSSHGAGAAPVTKILKVSEVTAVPDLSIDTSAFPLNGELLLMLHNYLAKSNMLLQQTVSGQSTFSHSLVLYAELRTRLLQVLERFLHDKESVQCCLEGVESGNCQIVPLLVNEIASQDLTKLKGKEKVKEDKEKEGEGATPAEQDKVDEEKRKLVTIADLEQQCFDAIEALHHLQCFPPNPPVASMEVDVQTPPVEETKEAETEKGKEKIKEEEKISVEVKEIIPRGGRARRGGKAGRGKGIERAVVVTMSEKQIYLAPWDPDAMAWNETSGSSLVFYGLDRLRVQFHGNNGDVLVYAKPIPDGVKNFYFEVLIENDDQATGVGIGLCPINNLPGWGDCFFEFRGNNGKKVAPRPKKDDEMHYHCPFCEQDKLNAVELCHHTTRRHAGSTLPVVCPICANSPFGDPNYISSNFFGHMENSHSDQLYGAAPTSPEANYSQSFVTGDVIGCGWSSDDGGVIFFTKNGKYLGPAFIDKDLAGVGRLVPMVRLRSPGVEVAANFGSKPFVFQPSNSPSEGDSESVRKLREEQEAKMRAMQEEEDSKLVAREVQAELLMSFVGLPREFCIYALTQNNDNVEQAASWSFDNFEQWSNEQARIQLAQTQTERKLEKSSVDYEEYPGEAYSFIDDSRDSQPSALAAASLSAASLVPGVKCTVSERVLEIDDPCGWVDARYQTIGRTGVILAIDRTRLLALLQFYDPERGLKEEWWYPLQALQPSEEVKASAQELGLGTEEERDKQILLLQSKVAHLEMKLSNLYARRSIISLLTHWPTGAPPSLSLTALGGPSGLLKTLRLIAKEHLCQPIPLLEAGRLAPSGSFLQILWENLKNLSESLSKSAVNIKSEELVNLLLAESARLLRKSARFSSSKVKHAESDHPYSGDQEPKQINIPGATGLIVTFDRNSKFTENDTLLLSLDDKQVKILRRFSGNALNQFHPVVVSSDRFWVQLKRASGLMHNDPLWGYRLTVTPTTDTLNLALWISEFLIEEGVKVAPGENVRGKVYTQLVEYLKASKCPDMMKTVIVRLLTRINKLTYDQCVRVLSESKDIKKEKPEAVEEMRKHLLELTAPSTELEEEMTDLLSEVNVLHSTYLQNLTELISINRKNAIIANIVLASEQPAAIQTPAVEPKVATPTPELKKSAGKGKRKGKEKEKEKEKEAEKAGSPSEEEGEAIFYPADESQAAAVNVASPENVIAQSAALEGRKTFTSVAALDVILNCWLHHMPFPRTFISKLGWNTSKAYDHLPKPQTTSGKLRLVWKGKLVDRARIVFTEIFYRFGVSQPGTMSKQELNNLQVYCHPNEPLNPDELKFFFDKYAAPEGNPERLSLQGFLNLYYRESYQHPKNVWEELAIFGYNNELVLAMDEAVKFWCDPATSRWTRHMDEQLVEFVNELAEISGKSPLDISVDEVILTKESDKQRFESIVELPTIALQLRLCCIRELNALVSRSLPFIDLTRLDVEGSLANRLCSLRHLIFYQTKVAFLDSILSRTATTKQSPNITIQRLKKVLKNSGGDRAGLLYSSGGNWGGPGEGGLTGNEKTVFKQAFKQLNQLDPATLRQNERAFKVTLKGERVEGEVGPYQETMSQLCSELQPEHSPEEEGGSSSAGEDKKDDGDEGSQFDEPASQTTKNEFSELPLFIPCPNMQLARQQIGVGENRDKWIPKPSSHSPKELRMFEFVGKLIGIAIRTKNILSLNLPAIFWKPLVGDTPTLSDLKAIDFNTIDSLEKIINMDKETFEASVFENFTTTLSDKTSVELLPGGKERSVAYEEREMYASLVQQARLNESSAQMKAIWKGMSAMVPVALLSLFTWQDLEMRVCGRTEINLTVLKRNTRYRGGIKPSDPHIVYFWEVLEEFSQHERMMFLRFAWGRQRLPSEMELKNEPMKIFPFPCDNPNTRMPHAETCFFNLKLPAYTSKEVTKEKMLYAITHTKTIDADVQEEDNGRGPGRLPRGSPFGLGRGGLVPAFGGRGGGFSFGGGGRGRRGDW